MAIASQEEPVLRRWAACSKGARVTTHEDLHSFIPLGQAISTSKGRPKKSANVA